MQPDPIVSQEQKKFSWLRRWPTLIILFIFVSAISFGAVWSLAPSSLTAALAGNGITKCIDDKGNNAILTWNYNSVLGQIVGAEVYQTITYRDALSQFETKMDRSSATPIVVKDILNGETKPVPNLTSEQFFKLIDFTGKKLRLAPFKCGFLNY